MPTSRWSSRALVVFAGSFLFVTLLFLLVPCGQSSSAAPNGAETLADVPLLTSTPTPVTLPYCWQYVPAPDQGHNWTNGTLASVSAVSSNDVWALAYYVDEQRISRNTAAHWNGTAWSLISIPVEPQFATLNDLVAISHDDVWVVGSNRNQLGGEDPLTIHWNGNAWSVVPSPSPSGGYIHNSLNAVDASGSNDVWAVGFSSYDEENVTGLAMHWNGTQWSSTPVPQLGPETYLTVVDVTSNSGAWAGGYGYTPTVDQVLVYWNGTAWINAIPQDHGAITGIAALSLTDVWASVYSYGAPVVPHFIHSNGTQWTNVSSQGEQVGEIEPVSSNDIWTTGYETLLHWNGQDWGRVPLQEGYVVWGLSAISSGDIWAVGNTRLGYDSRMLALHYSPSCIPGPPPTATRTPTLTTPTSTPTPEPPRCPGERFTDVCPGDPFYPYILPLADDGILSGYTSAPPCPNSLWIPCFRPNNFSSRGQISKVVSLAAGFNEPVSGQTFEDVPPGATFYTYTERLASRDIISGYPCGGSGEPCVPPENRPYFRTNHLVTRGQLSKMVSLAFNWTEPISGQQFEDVPPGSTFYDYIGRLSNRAIINGYQCGGPNEPCVPPDNLPYFRPNNNVTRGQTAKIVQLARTQPTPTPTSTTTSTSTPILTPTTTPTCCSDVTASISGFCQGSAYYWFTYTITNSCTITMIATGGYTFQASPNPTGPWQSLIFEDCFSCPIPPGVTQRTGPLWSGPLPAGDNWWRVTAGFSDDHGCWGFSIASDPQPACVLPASTSTPSATPTVTTPTPSSTPACPIIPGIIDVGNHCDNCVTDLNLPFAVPFYGLQFASVGISSNGNLQFISIDPSGQNSCLPAANLNYAVLGYWDDLRTDCTGCGVFTKVLGNPPNRTYVIEWRTNYNSGGTANFEVLLHEGSTHISATYGRVDHHGDSATVGTQKDTGSIYSQFECNSGGIYEGLCLTLVSSSASKPTTLSTNQR